jgi:nucleotide-binding universal stress UspA family protein
MTGTPARQRIVVGVDCTAASTWPLRLARQMGVRLDATVEAVFVYLPVTGYGWTADPGLMQPDELHRHMAGVLGQTIAEAFDGSCPLGLVPVAVPGDPARTLIEHARDAAMLVVGGRRRHGVTNLLLGSVATRCVERAPCPVLVVHGEDPGTEVEPRIVVGVDGSPASRAAMRWAALLADRDRASVDAVAVRPANAHTAESVELERLAEWVDEAVGPDRPATVHLHADTGDAAHQLLARAENAELLVVGNRGHGAVLNLLLGSVSARCAAQAPGPVLVVPVPPVDTGPEDRSAAGSVPTAVTS